MRLSAEETRQLERLALRSPHVTGATGTRRSRTRGVGLEFEDYRAYHLGDDPRAIDWTVDARLRQLVVRMFRAEGQLRVHLLLDVSRSMTVGTPDKLAVAARLAAAFAFMAAGHRDAVGLTTFDDRIRGHVAPSDGRGHLLRVVAAADAARAIGRSNPDAAFAAYAAALRGPGLAIILSDLLGPGLPDQGLRHLAHRGLSPVIVQVLAPEDLGVTLDNPVDLADAEDPDATRAADAASARAYRDAVAAHVRRLRELCRTSGWPYLQVTTTMTLPDALTLALDAGLLAVH